MIQCVSRALAWGIVLKNPSNHCEHSCNDEVKNCQNVNHCPQFYVFWSLKSSYNLKIVFEILIISFQTTKKPLLTANILNSVSLYVAIFVPEVG